MRRSVSFLIVVDEALDQIVLAPLLAEAVVGAELFQLFDSVGAVWSFRSQDNFLSLLAFLALFRVLLLRARFLVPIEPLRPCELFEAVWARVRVVGARGNVLRVFLNFPAEFTEAGVANTFVLVFFLGFAVCKIAGIAHCPFAGETWCFEIPRIFAPGTALLEELFSGIRDLIFCQPVACRSFEPLCPGAPTQRISVGVQNHKSARGDTTSGCGYDQLGFVVLVLCHVKELSFEYIIFLLFL